MEVVNLLLDRDVDVNIPGGNGYTALHVAASRGREAIVKLLLDNGADVNASAGVSCYTPLHMAICTPGERRTVNDNDVAVVKLLLDHGSHIGIENYWRKTPLECAKERRHENKECEEIYQLLKDKRRSMQSRVKGIAL